MFRIAEFEGHKEYQLVPAKEVLKINHALDEEPVKIIEPPNSNLELQHRTEDEEEEATEEDVVFTYYINENNIEECPQIKLQIGSFDYLGVLDTGCQISIMSEELYSEILGKGVKCSELPAQHVLLQSAFSDKTKRVKRQILLEIQFRSKVIDHVFLVSGQLATPLLIGTDFCTLLEAVIDFSRKKVTLIIDGRREEVDFVDEKIGAGARDCNPSDRDSRQTANSQSIHSHNMHHNDSTGLDRTIRTTELTVFRDVSTNPLYVSTMSKYLYGSDEKSYVDCPSSQRADDAVCYDENMKHRLRSRINEIAPSDGVSCDKYNKQKVSTFGKGACDPAANTERKGKYRTDQTTDLMVAKHSSEGETKPMHIHEKLLEQDDMTAVEREEMLKLLGKYLKHFCSK